MKGTLVVATDLVDKVRNKVWAPAPLFKLLNRNKQSFACPICKYEGPFADFHSFAGLRKHAMCPRCLALERHRLQYLVVRNVLGGVRTEETKLLHFAPEECFRLIFSREFPRYETADLFMQHVDHKVDITNLPFEDKTYDVIFASHVLEHIADDRKAIREIRRVLRPNGLAILPVPIVSACTIEYPEANPHEAGHVRAPGVDYFEKYRECFERVEAHSSELYPKDFQLFIYEDRSLWPTKECPRRRPMPGDKHPDFVPVCYV